MIKLNNYINEKLKVNSNSKIRNFDYFPKDYKELKEIINELIHKDNNADLNNIDISNITDLHDLFSHFGVSVHNIDISQWDVRHVTNMDGLFLDNINFNCDLSNWNVSNVENMQYMFSQCKSFDFSTIENWNVSKCKNMKFMFSDLNNSDFNLGKWDVSNVENMQYMFANGKNFTGKGLENWKINIKDPEKIKGIFQGCSQNLIEQKWYKEI